MKSSSMHNRQRLSQDHSGMVRFSAGLSSKGINSRQAASQVTASRNHALNNKKETDPNENVLHPIVMWNPCDVLVGYDGKEAVNYRLKGKEKVGDAPDILPKLDVDKKIPYERKKDNLSRTGLIENLAKKNRMKTQKAWSPDILHGEGIFEGPNGLTAFNSNSNFNSLNTMMLGANHKNYQTFDVNMHNTVGNPNDLYKKMHDNEISRQMGLIGEETYIDDESEMNGRSDNPFATNQRLNRSQLHLQSSSEEPRGILLSDNMLDHVDPIYKREDLFKHN